MSESHKISNVENANANIYVPLVKPPEMDNHVKELTNFFVNNFLCQPKFIVKVPGR